MEQPNLSYINTLSGGDKEFEAQLLDVVKKEFPTEKETYYKNLNNKNLSFRIAVIETTINQNTLLTTHNSQPVF